MELILIATLDRSARNVAPILMTQTYVSCVCGRTLKRIVTSQVLIPVVLLNQPSLSVRMTLSRRQRYRNFLLTLQHRLLCRTTRTLSRTVRPLVPYVRQSTTSSSSVQHSKPLETHGIFRNYQSFHRLSGDNEKEARTAAYYDLTSLMISQTDEPPLINVSSARPKMEDPFPHGAVSSNEMKKKSEKMILQWPPQSSHNKVIDRTLGLYQHGPPPKAGTNEKWPPPTVKNPWDKSFVPKEFPITHKIPSTMPKRWDLHSSSPLMLRPPLSTAVPEVPDAAISKSSSWLEAFAARAAHTATMSATSIISVYNFQQKVLEFLRDSVAKNNIQNDISVIDDLFQRANSMALEGHIMAHDSGVTATELFTHLHMLRRRSVLEDPSVSLPQRDKDRLLVMEVGGRWAGPVWSKRLSGPWMEERHGGGKRQTYRQSLRWAHTTG